MKVNIRLCLSLLLICLLGCATAGGIADNLTSVPEGKGLVLFSTSADTTNLAKSTSLALVQGSSQKKYDKVIINIDYPFSSNFADQHGHARTLALPEGDYYLVPSSANPYFVTTRAPVYKFRAAKGRITYIGNFHLSAVPSLSWSDSKYKRDTDYFLQRNPNLASIRIDIQKPELASNVSQFKTKGIIWDLP